MRHFHRPHFDSAAPAARARTITLQMSERARRARRELLAVIPLIAASS